MADTAITRTNHSKVYLPELQRLEKLNGGYLRPHDVVEAARDEDSPIHNWFEWDDTAAAERYRLAQARVLMVTVRVNPRDELPAFTNAHLTVNNVQVRGYISTDKAISDDEIYQQMLARSLKELDYFQNKYSHIAELKGVIDTKKLEALRNQAEKGDK